MKICILVLVIVIVYAFWTKRAESKQQQVKEHMQDKPADSMTRAEFGVTAEEGRNVQSVQYDINPISKLESFKLFAEFL